MRTIRLIAALVVVAGLAFVDRPAAAGGGGGCDDPRTQAEGTTVELVNICISPTVLTTDVGATVTFVNGDDFPHNVVGHQFYADLPERGSTAEYRFDEPGIYPFACTLHVGMVGSIVVGGAAEPGGDVVAVAAPEAEAIRSELLGSDTADRTEREMSLAQTTGAAAAVGVLAFLLGRWTRRRPSEPID